MAIMPSQYTIKTKVSEDHAAIMFLVVIFFLQFYGFYFGGKRNMKEK
jgi:hypothetical protein